MRQAIVIGEANDVDVIRRYLPENYKAFTWACNVVIEGQDVSGWTLDGYVIPRLASGNYSARELS